MCQPALPVRRRDRPLPARHRPHLGRHRRRHLHYRVNVDEGSAATPADWAALSVDQATSASPLRVDLSGGTAYQWRVATHSAALAASNPLAGTTVSFTPASAFTTSGTPGGGAAAQVVVPTFPTSTSTPLYTLTPALQWYVQGGALAGTTYQVQYRTAAGAYPASPQGTGLTGLSFTTAALTPGTGYAWQARACVAATCGAWSTEHTFSVHSTVVAPNAAPAAPAALAPASGVTVYGSTVKLTWAASASNLTYRAWTRVCATPDCAAERATTSGYTETNTGTDRKLSLPITSGQSVAWYVTACTATNVCSVPSSVAYFTVGATAATATRAVPSSPVSSALVYTLTPELRWYLSGGTAGVGGYEVRYGATSDPATFIGSGATSGASATGLRCPRAWRGARRTTGTSACPARPRGPRHRSRRCRPRARRRRPCSTGPRAARRRRSTTSSGGTSRAAAPA